MGKKRTYEPRRKRLFYKYLSVITSVSLLSVLIVCLTYLGIASSYWNKEQLGTLERNTKIISENSEKILSEFSGRFDSGEEVDISPLSIICNTIKNMSMAIDADIFIINMDGEVVVCKEMMGDKFRFNSSAKCVVHRGYKIDQSIIDEASDNGYTEVGRLGGAFVKTQLSSASPIKLNGKTVAIVIASEKITSSWYSYAKRILQIFLIAALFSLLISFLTVYYLSYRLTRPLRDMVTATQHYAQGDFSYKVKVRGNDEMAQLSEAFNSMAMSLSALESSRRSFVANVSHELKTPMTSIGGFIDGMLDGTISADKYDYYLKLVSDEVKRLSRLVTGMLNMSKLEAGEMQANIKQFDISVDIFKTLLSFERKINEKEIEILGLDKMDSMPVNADEDMMMQVVYNLIDNAVKFTPQGGYIEFKTYHDKEKVFVSIRNSGSGIEREEADKIFERFYKIDKSRSYDVKGAGLGLYLVKSIIELHGGQIVCNSQLGEYTEFVFWLPNV